MAGMFVPQLVAPVNTGGLADIGRTIGSMQEDAGIADIMKGLDPNDPNSFTRTMTKLSAYGGPTARDMVDRMTGVWNAREQVKYNREAEAANQKAAREAYGSTLKSPAMSGPIPTDEPAARPPPSPTASAPAAQQVSDGGPFNRPGGAVPSTNRTVGDQEGVDSGLYEAPAKTIVPAAAAAVGAPTAPATGIRMAGGPLGGAPLQQLPPPPPRNPAATGPTPSPLPPAPPGPTGAAPAAPAAVPQGASAAPIRPPVVTAPAPTAPGLAGIPPTPPPYEGLVGTPPPEIGRVAPRASDTQIQQMITELNVRKGNPDLDTKHKEFIQGRVHQLEKELENRRKQDDEVYKARVKFQEGYSSKRVEHALKANDEVTKQLKSDFGSAAALSEQSRILQDGLRTGALSDWGQWTDRAKDLVGTLIDKLPGVDKNREFEWVKSARDTAGAMERFNGIAAKSLSDLLGGFGNRVSDADAKRMDSMVANSQKTVRGNAQLIKFANDLVQARIAGAQEVQRYMKERQSQGLVVDASDIASIQAAYAKHAIDKMEAEFRANPLPAGPTPGGGKTTPVPTPAARGGPAVKAITQDEYNRLPSGATYTAPDGTLRTKGGT